jgi:hypothetical protein
MSVLAVTMPINTTKTRCINRDFLCKIRCFCATVTFCAKPPKPPKSDNERIAIQLEALGIDWKDAEAAKAAIKSITQLEPEEANFPEIAARLSIRVQEQREAKAEAEKLKQSNAAPVR